MTGDLLLIENGDGGDLVLNGNDVQMTGGFQNMPYLAMFGGNVGFPTSAQTASGQNFDFWGNYFLNPDNKAIWFNSLTEQLLAVTALTPLTRIQIEENIKKDVEFMGKFAQLTVSVSLVLVDRIRISIIILEPDNVTSNEFVYIWDATEAELSVGDITPTTGQGIALGFILGFDL